MLEKEPHLDAIQCSVYLVNNQLGVVGANRCDPSKDTLLDFLLFENLPGFGSTLLARRSRIEALGGFGEDLVILEDWDLACRLARLRVLRSLPDFLVLYRQHPGNRSRDVGIHIEPGFRSLTRFFADAGLEPAVRTQKDRVWARLFAMLAGGYAKNRQWRQSVYWAWRAVAAAPQSSTYLVGLMLHHVCRRLSRMPRLSFADELPFAILQTGL